MKFCISTTWQFRPLVMILALVAGLTGPAFAQDMKEQFKPAINEQQVKELMALNKELEAVAKEITELLQHPGFRGQLRGEINGAKTIEGIIELDKFLAKAAKHKNAPPGLAKSRGATDKANQRLKNSPEWGIEGIDLYFPVGDHRSKWKGNEDLFVGYSPISDDVEIEGIVAFSVKTGERLILDPKKPPSTPVLIVAAEEHDDHDMPVGTRAIRDLETEEEEEVQSLTGIHYRGNDPEDKPVEQEPGNSYVGLRQMYIRDTKEPWTSGNPEIKILFGQRKGNYCYAKYTPTESALKYLDDERRWKTTWHNTPPRTTHCQSGSNTSGYDTCFYFDSTFSTKMVLYIYEQDGSPRNRWTKVNTLYPGVTCSWGLRNSDDYVDSTYMYRTNFLYQYDYKQDMGNAVVRWHKVH